MSMKNSNWCDEMGLAAGWNVNNLWDWKGNANKTWNSLGAGMGINHWEREG